MLGLALTSETDVCGIRHRVCVMWRQTLRRDASEGTCHVIKAILCDSKRIFLSWRRWILFQDRELLPGCGGQDERRNIVWLVSVIDLDTNLADWNASNRITQEVGKEAANKILRTWNCMTEVERQEVSNRRKVTGNEQDGEIKNETRRKSERVTGGFVSKLSVQDVSWGWGGFLWELLWVAVSK